MAGIGLKNFKYAILNSDGETYGQVKTLAGAIECKVSLDLSEATLYSDDVLKEQVSIFKNGTLTAGIDDDDDTVFAELLGQTRDTATGIVTSKVSDNPIYVGFGHIVPKMINGARKYKVEFFPKVKFKPFMTDATTKGDNLEFTTPSVEATIFESNGGIWEKHGVYNSEMAAINALNAMFGQSSVTISITEQPQDTDVTEGSISGSLSVTASATSGTLSYQWYSNTVYSNINGTEITDATSSSFTIPTTLTTSDSPKYYYCIVSHPSAPSIVSNVAKVTIES